MGIVATKAISAENQWSDVFELQGDSGHIPNRRALVNVSASGSKVTIRRYAAATDAVTAFMSSLDLDSTMSAVEIPVGGLYRVGVATDNYGGTALTIRVEQ